MRRPALGLAAIAIPLAALAGTGNYMDRSNHKPTEVSGLEADVIAARIPPDSQAVAIRGLGVFRNGKGQSCGVYAGVAPLTGREETKQEHYTLRALTSGAEGNVDNDEHIRLTKAACNGEMRVEDASRQGDGYFVRGVTVCTDDGDSGNRSIQGLRVWYSKLKANGTLEKLDEPETWVGPKCTRWEDRAMCPPGWLAVGIKAHKSYGGFRALGFKCAELKNRQE